MDMDNGHHSHQTIGTSFIHINDIAHDNESIVDVLRLNSGRKRPMLRTLCWVLLLQPKSVLRVFDVSLNSNHPIIGVLLS